jgi:clan AA aspartic protease
MISGAVTANREAVIRLTVRGPAGPSQRVTAIIDTGFDGTLTLPNGLIALLRLPFMRRGGAVLADGSQAVFDIYQGTVVWDRRRILIRVDEAETTPLIGMELLEGHELNAQIRTRGKVTIKRLSR